MKNPTAEQQKAMRSLFSATSGKAAEVFIGYLEGCLNADKDTLVTAENPNVRGEAQCLRQLLASIEHTKQRNFEPNEPSGDDGQRHDGRPYVSPVG